MKEIAGYIAAVVALGIVFGVIAVAVVSGGREMGKMAQACAQAGKTFEKTGSNFSCK